MKLDDVTKNMLLLSIRRVLKTGEPWKAKDLHYPAETIIEVVLTIEGMTKAKEEEDGFTTNGWQWDWWQEFTYEGKTYKLSGSGYYGGHAFQLADEQKSS